MALSYDFFAKFLSCTWIRFIYSERAHPEDYADFRHHGTSLSSALALKGDAALDRQVGEGKERL